jgi:hypothetical protein
MPPPQGYGKLRPARIVASMTVSATAIGVSLVTPSLISLAAAHGADAAWCCATPAVRWSGRLVRNAEITCAIAVPSDPSLVAQRRVSAAYARSDDEMRRYHDVI